MKNFRPIICFFIATGILAFIYNGTPTGRKTLYIEVISTKAITGYSKGGYATYYTANVKLESGDVINIKSGNRDLLSLQDGYLEFETSYSPLTFKTTYEPISPY